MALNYFIGDTRLTRDQGTADVKAVYSGKKLEVNVSTYGMVILLAFNDVPPGGSLTFEVCLAFITIKFNAHANTGTENNNIYSRK